MNKNFETNIKQHQIYSSKITQLINILPLILFAIIFTGLHFFYVKNINKNFIEQNKIIVKNISTQIINIDNNITQILYNTLPAWSHMIHKNNDKIYDIKNNLGISRLSIIDISGVSTDYDTDQNHPDSKKLNEKYKNDAVYFSIFKSTCQEYKDLQNKSLQNIPIVTPIVVSKMRQIPVKWAIMFDSNIKKYLYAEYSRDYFSNMLFESSKAHNNISYIEIVDPVGGKIASFGNYNNKKNVYSAYSNVINISENKDTLFMSLPFGEVWHNKMEVCFLSKTKDRITQNGEYFYVLNINFDKQELNANIRHISIFFFCIFLVFCFASIMIKKYLIYRLSKNINKILRL